MRWSNILQAWSDPNWAAGGLLIARRAGEASLPIGKRLATAFVAAIPAATLAATGALFGGYIALRDTVNDIRTEFRTEDIRIRAAMQERTTLREEQMMRFERQCTDTQRQLGAIEQRITAAEHGLLRLQALEDVRHKR